MGMKPICARLSCDGCVFRPVESKLAGWIAESRAAQSAEPSWGGYFSSIIGNSRLVARA